MSILAAILRFVAWCLAGIAGAPLFGSRQLYRLADRIDGRQATPPSHHRPDAADTTEDP